MRRVQAFQFDACLIGGKTPIDLRGLSIASLLPGRNLLFKPRLGAYSSVQALTRKHTEFNLGHIEPTAVFWSEMNFQFFAQPTRQSRSERFVQRSGRVRIQIIHDQHNLFGMRIADLD